jgi:hypothetical protein
VESERSGQSSGPEAAEPTGASRMRIVATKDAVDFISGHGGELYVWPDLMNCPGCALPFLTASTEPPQERREFTRLSGDDFDLLYNDGDVERPGHLIVEISGWRRKRISVRTPDFWIKE